MKNLFSSLLIAALAVVMTGCDAFRSLSNTQGTTSQGKPYEVIVVCPHNEWNGPIGDSLRSLLTAPVPYINQTEPLFDVLRVTERGFTNLVVNHRNILKVVVDPSLKEASVGVQYDVTASPQIVMTLQGPDDRSIEEYLARHGGSIVDALEMAERDRAVDYASKYNNSSLHELIFQMFGFEMDVPKGYVLAKKANDFIWARYEYPAASQGFFIYSYPYAGKQSLTVEALVEARNQFATRIPGPSDGSYMTTSNAFEPDLKMYRLNGRLWCELRGFWDVEGDFMGGPFVSFSTVDTATNRVITLDCYVYSPKLHKRNFVRGVEHLLYTIKFPEDGKSAQ